MDAREALKILGPLVAAFPTVTISPETLAVYAASLRPFQASQLRAAVIWAIGSSKRFPSIAELSEQAGRQARSHVLTGGMERERANSKAIEVYYEKKMARDAEDRKKNAEMIGKIAREFLDRHKPSGPDMDLVDGSSGIPKVVENEKLDP